MTHYFVAANAWLAVALTLLIGQWGSEKSGSLFGYGRIEPPVCWAAAAGALLAAGYCMHRWVRAEREQIADAPAVPYFALAQGWLIAGLVLLLGMQRADSNAYRLYGYGRIEPLVYWGVLATAFGAGVFCLLRWGRNRTAGPPTANRDLARVGLGLMATLGVYSAVWMADELKPMGKPDEAIGLGGAFLVYLSIVIVLARKAFGPLDPAARRKRLGGMADGMWAGILMVGVATVGLLVVSVLGTVYPNAQEPTVWFVVLLGVGLLGAVVLLVAVLAPRSGAGKPRPGGRGPRQMPDATTMLLRALGAVGTAVMFSALLFSFSPRLGPAWPPAAKVMLFLLACGVVVAIGLFVTHPVRRHKPPAELSRCPTCGEPIAPGSPAGLCPRCLLSAAVPAATNTTPTLAFVESFTAPPVEDVRRLFPHLAVDRLIGQGGMGAVYLAGQPALDRPVALKLIRRRSDDPTFVERFGREARAMARLAHPNVVAVHESGEAGGLPYLVMEYVGESTLRDAMRAKSLSPAETLAIVRQVCDALEYAHRQGVVHRDIKPENILLQIDKSEHEKASAEDASLPSQAVLPRAKITDFGLAKVAEPNGVSLTGTWQAMGTPHYMAPEQWERPGAVDHRADIYALGVVLYELLTGELPLGRFDPPSRTIGVDVRMDEVVLRALEKEPGRRYQHAREVGTDLDHIRCEQGR